MTDTRGLLSGYRFVFAYGPFRAGFQKISGLGSSITVEYINEGGCSGYAYPIQSAKGGTGKLTFEKGFGYYNPFYGPRGFAPGTRIESPCGIAVMDRDGAPRRFFAFDYGIITTWECSPLDAGASELLIDKVEIEHTGLYEMGVN